MAAKTEKSWLTVGVPESTDGLIEVFEPSAALRVAIVERAKIRSIDEADWQEPGVYVLLYRHRKPNAWECYVGKATALRSRVLYHANDKDRGPWYRALLIRRDTTHGFNSAQIAWLESRLHRKLTSSAEATLRNKQEPGNENLPTDEHWLENVAPAVLRVLQMLGHNPAAADDDGGRSTETSRTRRTFTVTIPDLVSANLLSDGEELVSTNSRWPANGYVTKAGKIGYDGQAYDSPSSAAQAAKKGGAANGWEFWSAKRAAGKVSLAELRAEFRSSKKGTRANS